MLAARDHRSTKLDLLFYGNHVLCCFCVDGHEDRHHLLCRGEYDRDSTCSIGAGRCETWLACKEEEHPTVTSPCEASQIQAAIHPYESETEIAHRETLKLLFVCSMNQWRSPTAEHIHRSRLWIDAPSRGISPNARKMVTPEDMKWAEIVFVMKDKHKHRLRREYPAELQHNELHVPDTPDIYNTMNYRGQSPHSEAVFASNILLDARGQSPHSQAIFC